MTPQPGAGSPPHLAPFFFEKININQANPALLQIIPGIGPELASRIINKRDERGGFSSPEQLLEVRGGRGETQRKTQSMALL